MQEPRYPIRTSGVQLPHARELFDILAKESQRRAVRYDFIQTHRYVFDAYRDLMHSVDVNPDWIINYADMSLDELADTIVIAHEKVRRHISENTEQTVLYRNVFECLTVQEPSATADAIFVFGSESNARIERAVELYEAESAPKIIVSGKGPHYRETHQSEAKRMADFARAAGVLADALIVEGDSITLPDNVKRTLDLMETMAWKPTSMIVIATNFVLRRATMEWYKFAPWPIKIVPVAARSKSSYFTADTWYRNSDSIALVLNEYAKMILESKIDLIRREG